MKKFHITIKDNETGDILNDQDTCAIIGAFDFDDEGTGSLIYTNCVALEMAATAESALRAALRASKQLPAWMQAIILKNNGLKDARASWRRSSEAKPPKTIIKN